MTTLSLHLVTKTYAAGSKKVPVIAPLSYTFSKGTSYALVGASGSGKSTLLHLLGGFTAPTSGSVLWGNRSLDLFTPKERTAFMASSLGVMFQDHYLLSELTIAQNILLACQVLPVHATASSSDHVFNELIEKFGLVDLLDRYPHELSGGQQQRAALARALVRKPAFLLADEPTGNLDEEASSQVGDLLFSYQKKYGMGLVLATHDKRLATRADVVLTLQNGVLGE